MSKYYRISLICVMIIAIIALFYMLFRYENDNSAPINDMVYGTSEVKNYGADRGEVYWPANTNTRLLTSSYMQIAIIEQYPQGVRREYNIAMPEELRGIDRETISEMLTIYRNSPDELDCQKGLTNIELLTFSENEMTILKCYNQELSDYYYLSIQDGYVVVLCEDQKTVLLRTDISSTVLPVEIRNKLETQNILVNSGELFDFLESYTS